MLELHPESVDAQPRKLTPELLADLLARLALLEQALRDEREQRLTNHQQPVIIQTSHEPAYPTTTVAEFAIPAAVSPEIPTSTSEPSELAFLRIQVQEWQYRYEVLWEEHQQARRAILELQQKIMSIPL